MSIEEIRRDLAQHDPDEGYYPLCREHLVGLVATDLPKGTGIQVEPPDNCYTDEHPEGYIYRGNDTPLEVIIREDFPLKHWEGDLSASAYLKLMGKTLARRQKSHGDVRVDENAICDDRWIHLHYAILILAEDISEAWVRAVAVNKEIRKAVNDQTAVILKRIEDLD
jgi:hypothetical protein